MRGFYDDSRGHFVKKRFATFIASVCDSIVLEKLARNFIHSFLRTGKDSPRPTKSSGDKFLELMRGAKSDFGMSRDSPM